MTSQVSALREPSSSQLHLQNSGPEALGIALKVAAVAAIFFAVAAAFVFLPIIPAIIIGAVCLTATGLYFGVCNSPLTTWRPPFPNLSLNTFSTPQYSHVRVGAALPSRGYQHMQYSGREPHVSVGGGHVPPTTTLLTSPRPRSNLNNRPVVTNPTVSSFISSAEPLASSHVGVGSARRTQQTTAATTDAPVLRGDSSRETRARNPFLERTMTGSVSPPRFSQGSSSGMPANLGVGSGHNRRQNAPATFVPPQPPSNTFSLGRPSHVGVGGGHNRPPGPSGVPSNPPTFTGAHVGVGSRK